MKLYRQQLFLVLVPLFILSNCHNQPAEQKPEENSAKPSDSQNDKPHPCLDNRCGDGKICHNEECDDGNSDSYDGCSSNCTKEAGQKLTYMNWNILVSDQKVTSSILYEGSTYTYTVDYSQYGGSMPLPPRAEAMRRALDSMTDKPGFIAVMEMDPVWKWPENYGLLLGAGYKALYPHTPFMLTQVLYRPERFNLLEKNYINLSTRFSGRGSAMKSAVTYGVFQEKESGEIFVILSTHWDPNNGVNLDNGLGGALDKVYECEQTRVRQAEESCNLIANLRAAYPTAHFIYGGDLNTIDFSILFNLIAALLPDFDTSFFTLSTLAKMFGSKVQISDDFAGGKATFEECSGLIGSRAQALANNVAVNDHASTGDPGIPQVITDSGVPLVIDYSFYSPEMALLSYAVMDGENFVDVSDHRGIKIELTYYPRGQQLRTVPVFPDDTSTDLYLPAAIYQGEENLIF